MTLLGRTHKRWRLCAYMTTISALVLAIFVLFRHDNSRQHVLSRRPDMAELLADYAEAHEDVKRDEVNALCRFHGFRPYGQPRKVYDLIAFTSSLDWLEIRLNTLAAHVDYFVIAESSITNVSAGGLALSQNWDRFRAFHDKIMYRAVDISPARVDATDYMNNLQHAVFTEVLASSVSTDKKPNPGDVLIVGDMHELPRPGTISILRHCDPPSRTTLASQSFLYSFALHRTGFSWLYPQATTFGSSLRNTILPSDLRRGLLPWSLRVRDIVYLPYHAARRWWDRAVILDAAWNCSLCHGTIEEVQREMQDLGALDAAGNVSVIVDHVHASQDLSAGEDRLLRLVEQKWMDLPEYVWEQWKEHGRFGYLVDRSGPGAGFGDIPETFVGT
ncbi:hypothetical protein CLAFUR0_14455 [Fulvia fulva]|nr:hypothetical protein CLAFUR0_14455 [Fulvia fulva]